VSLEVQIGLRFSLQYAGWITSKISLIVLQCVQPVNFASSCLWKLLPTWIKMSKCPQFLWLSSWFKQRLAYLQNEINSCFFFWLYFVLWVTSTWATLCTFTQKSASIASSKRSRKSVLWQLDFTGFYSYWDQI